MKTEEYIKKLKMINPDIELIDDYIDSKTKIKFKCLICGNEWIALPTTLIKKNHSGCPSCATKRAASLRRISNEDFIKRVNEFNASIQPMEVYKGSGERILCKCNKCGYEWYPRAGALLRGSGCPSCAGVLKKTNEQFVEELKVVLPNVEPIDEYLNASSKIRCRCLSCGNIWTTTPNSLLYGHGCKRCASKKTGELLRLSDDDFIRRLKELSPSIKPLEKYELSNKKIRCVCTICGYEWSPTPNYLLMGGGCVKCRRIYQTSFAEQAVFFYVKKFFPDAINGFRDVFDNNELDIFIPSTKIGIEYDGRFWHKKSFQKEIRKYEICKKESIRLIRIRESDLNNSDLSMVADYVLSSKYNGRTYDELSSCISELLEFLGIDTVVDVNKDYLGIQELYYSLRNEKFLAICFPELAKEWYQEQNGCITPEMVVSGSQYQYSWKCRKCGYIWKATVASRTNKRHQNGCPMCAGTLKKSNEEFLENLRKITESIEPLEEYISADTKIKCRCKICNKEWMITPSKLLNGRGCPVCAVRKTTKTPKEFYDQLAEKRPDIICLSEYIDRKTKILFKCKTCGYEWKALPNSVLARNKCRKCNGTAPLTDKEFMVQISSLNSSIDILTSYVGSNKKIKCRCKKCKNEWNTTPARLKSGNGCPVCNSPRKTNEMFVVELSKKNSMLEPLQEYKGTFSEICFRCKKCGNEWKSKPTYILKYPRCPKCGKKNRMKSNEEFRKELLAINCDIELLEDYKGVHIPISVMCKRCHSVFRKAPHELLRGKGCINCRI